MSRCFFGLSLLAFALLSTTAQAEDQWVSYPGGEGPGKGKKVVLISGDEEYRSEEALPMLAQILSQRHGFECTVLFAINPEDGTIDPNNQTNIPGMEKLKTADLCILMLRFRELPDKDMKHFVDYLESGKPIIGIRTSTHAFHYTRDKQSPYAHYGFASGDKWKGGFGQQVLGDTWVNHHGNHGGESTRGIINEEHADHPILKGVKDVWGPTDVYGIIRLPEDAQVLLHGQVLAGMKPDSQPVEGKKNDPMMPLVWVREHKTESGNTAQIVGSTFGSAPDFESEDSRRLIVNASYYLSGLEDAIPEKANVDYVKPFEPTFFGFNKFKKGMKPSDFEL
ncbi:MAG: ThuA domain-containing protein [Pirellulaceae bacterium]